MTSRERWTVYPLLFLALGAALRGRLSEVEEVRTVRCENLMILGPDGKPAAQIASQQNGEARLNFFNTEGKLTLSAGTDPKTQTGLVLVDNARGTPQVILHSTGQAGVVETYGPAGLPGVLLTSAKLGGSVRTISSDGKSVMTLGSNDEETGVMMDDIAHQQHHRALFATLTRPEPRPAEPKPEEPKPEPQPELVNPDAKQ